MSTINFFKVNPPLNSYNYKLYIFFPHERTYSSAAGGGVADNSIFIVKLKGGITSVGSRLLTLVTISPRAAKPKFDLMGILVTMGSG